MSASGPPNDTAAPHSDARWHECLLRARRAPDEGLPEYIYRLGAAVALFGLIENMLLFAVLVSSRKRRDSPLSFLIVLTLADTINCVLYQMLFTLPDVVTVTHSVHLHRFVVCRRRKTIFVCSNAVGAPQRRLVTERKVLIIGTGAVAFLVSAPMIFEYKVVSNPECLGLVGELNLDLNVPPLLWRIVDYYVRNIVHTFAPCVFLAYYNTRIVLALRQHSRQASLFLGRAVSPAHRAKLRDAALMMMAIVSTWVMANLLHMVLLIWGVLDPEYYIQHWDFYKIAHPAVTVLSITVCTIRLPIYITFSKEIRHSVVHALYRLHLCSYVCDGGQRLPHRRTLRSRKGISRQDYLAPGSRRQSHSAHSFGSTPRTFRRPNWSRSRGYQIEQIAVAIGVVLHRRRQPRSSPTRRWRMRDTANALQAPVPDPVKVRDCPQAAGHMWRRRRNRKTAAEPPNDERHCDRLDEPTQLAPLTASNGGCETNCILDIPSVIISNDHCELELTDLQPRKNAETDTGANSSASSRNASASSQQSSQSQSHQWAEIIECEYAVDGSQLLLCNGPAQPAVLDGHAGGSADGVGGQPQHAHVTAVMAPIARRVLRVHFNVPRSDCSGKQ